MQGPSSSIKLCNLLNALVGRPQDRLNSTVRSHHLAATVVVAKPGGLAHTKPHKSCINMVGLHGTPGQELWSPVTEQTKVVLASRPTDTPNSQGGCMTAWPYLSHQRESLVSDGAAIFLLAPSKGSAQVT